MWLAVTICLFATARLANGPVRALHDYQAAYCTLVGIARNVAYVRVIISTSAAAADDAANMKHNIASRTP